MLFSQNNSFVLKVFLLALGAGLAFPAGGQAATVTNCDRLTSHPSDPGSVADGVPFGQLDADIAIPACLDALATHSDDENTGRLHFQLARAYWKRHDGDYEGQAEYVRPNLEKSAERQYPKAFEMIEYWYSAEAGNEQMAFAWALRGAAADEVLSLHSTGMRFLDGQGTPVNTELGRFYLNRAAELGYGSSQYRLIVMYSETGDSEIFAPWMEKEAEGGYWPAEIAVGINRFLVGLAYYSDEALAESRQWLKKGLANARESEATDADPYAQGAAILAKVEIEIAERESKTASDPTPVAAARDCPVQGHADPVFADDVKESSDLEYRVDIELTRSCADRPVEVMVTCTVDPFLDFGDGDSMYCGEKQERRMIALDAGETEGSGTLHFYHSACGLGHLVDAKVTVDPSCKISY